MIPELIDRRARKDAARETLRDAQASPLALTALYLALILVMDLADSLTGGGLMGTFVLILINLLAVVLEAGFVLYYMAIRRGERAELLTLFDGFSFAGKVVLLGLLRSALIYLWSLLFVIPGLIAAYRYRFAIYNLGENPDLGVLEAFSMGKQQSYGYKWQLFTLDMSYLGWALLAGLPSYVYSAAAYQFLLQETAALYGAVFEPAAWASLIYALPAWGWVLLIGLWRLAVGIFYLPSFQCVDLDYFETAKRTSGVGSGVMPGGPSYWERRDGPDDLGGY